METTKHKVGRVLLIITLIISFIGCLLMAITLPFLSSVGVASADSSVIANNLLTDSDFTTWDLNTSYTGGSFYNIYNDWWINATTNQSTISFTDNGYGELVVTATGVRNLFQPMKKDDINWGTKYNFYISIDGDVLGNVVQFADSEPSSTTTYEFFQGSEVWLRFTYWPNGLNLGSQVIYGGWFISFRVNFSGVLNWVKAENSDAFTGYVSQEVYNNIYGQGLEEGYNNEFDLRNYRLLDPFSYSSTTSTNINFPSDNYSSSFTFDNKRFGVSTYYPITSLVPTAYNYLCPFYTLYSSTTTYYNGIKYTNDLLSGDILITFPFRFANNEFDIMFCFEDTVTGSLNYVTSKDSLHWFWGDVIGSTYGSYQVFTCSVHYYSANPVNLYVFQVGLNPVYNTTDIDVIVTRAIWFPLDCIWANIYATSTGSALNDFDSGYNQGKKDGIASVDTDSYYNYGYRQGYDKGHTDGVAEHTNYSFLGLISAVVDAPIKAFSGLLEFEILGVNLKNFVLGLLTLAVIIIIIKIALGGK